jgi:hypothetical protein
MYELCGNERRLSLSSTTSGIYLPVRKDGGVCGFSARTWMRVNDIGTPDSDEIRGDEQRGANMHLTIYKDKPNEIYPCPVKKGRFYGDCEQLTTLTMARSSLHTTYLMVWYMHGVL